RPASSPGSVAATSWRRSSAGPPSGAAWISSSRACRRPATAAARSRSASLPPGRAACLALSPRSPQGGGGTLPGHLAQVGQVGGGDLGGGGQRGVVPLVDQPVQAGQVALEHGGGGH